MCWLEIQPIIDWSDPWFRQILLHYDQRKRFLVDIIQTQKSIMVKFLWWGEGYYQFLTLTKYHTLSLFLTLSETWESVDPAQWSESAMTFRSWMHYRILSQLLKAMRGRILRITFPQRPQTFGLRGLKVLHEGYLKAQERKYLVPIFLVKIIIIYDSDGEIIRKN